MARFIAEQIEVQTAAGGRPVAFTWNATQYRIVKVEAMHRVIDHTRPWYGRRHRDNYVVRTDSGEVFRLYFHRGPGRSYWVLYEKLED